MAEFYMALAWYVLLMWIKMNVVFVKYVLVRHEAEMFGWK